MNEATVSPAAMRIINLLIGNPPQTVANLIRATGVTRTAVTEQLNELVAGGFAERTTERLPGRGRPRHLYAATQAALLLLFANGQCLVVPAIWQAIDEIGGKDLSRKVLKRASHKVAEHYRRRITGRSPRERLQQMSELMRQEGALVEIGQNEKGHLVLRKRSCSFISMFEESRAVCGMDEEIMAELVGAQVRRIACRHDGDPCCKFELLSSNGI
jgi:DeoR family transcriptional regulator, suf operon transcriptional repressor